MYIIYSEAWHPILSHFCFWDNNSTVHVKSCSRLLRGQLFPDGALCDTVHCEVSPVIISYVVSDSMPVDQVFCKLLYSGFGSLFKSRKGKCMLIAVSLSWVQTGLNPLWSTWLQVAGWFSWGILPYFRFSVDLLSELCNFRHNNS